MARDPRAEIVVQSNLFAGLNLNSSPVAQEINEAVSLVNLKPDLSGRLVKRKGTDSRLIYSTLKDVAGYVHAVSTNNGIPITLLATQRDIVVYREGFGLVAFFSNLFKFDDAVEFVTLPNEPLTVLCLTKRHPPVQVTFHEYSTVASVDGYVEFTKAYEILRNQTVGDEAKLFKNKAVTTKSITVDPPLVYAEDSTGFTVAAGDVFDLLYVTWQWWAEAETWYGDRFYKEVPRFGVSNLDAVVPVPDTITSDLSDEFLRKSLQFGINPYYSNKPVGTKTTYVTSYTPTFDVSLGSPPTVPDKAWTYTFSDAQVFTKDANNSLRPSPYFITFGDKSNDVVREVNQLAYDSTNKRFTLPSHQFKNGDRIQLVDGGGVVRTVYVLVINKDVIQLAANQDGTGTPTFTAYPGPTASFADADIDFTNDHVNVGSGVTEGTNVRFEILSGNILGVVNGESYYVKNISGTEFELYYDAGLNVRANLTAATPGTYRIRPWFNLIQITKLPYDRVCFTRFRECKFNSRINTLIGDIDVYLDDIAVTLNSSPASKCGGWLASSVASPIVANITTSGAAPCRYYSVYSADDDDDAFGLPAYSRVRIINKEAKWINAQEVKFDYNNTSTHKGGYVPAYGLGYYADYFNGKFPSLGTVYQGRLALSGFTDSGLTIFSAIGDSYVRSEYYNYFQVTDDLDGAEYDPFELYVDDPTNNTVTAIASWQRVLFVFTSGSCYRSVGQLLTAQNKSLTLIGNQGAIAQSCVSVSASVMFFMSFYGLYRMSLAADNEYRPEDVSAKVSPLFTDLAVNSWLGYNPIDYTLYVGLNYNKLSRHSTELYSFDTRTEAWCKYFTYLGFKVYDYTYGISTPLITVTDGIKQCHVLELESSQYTDFYGNAASVIVPYGLLDPDVGINTYSLNFYSTKLMRVLDFELRKSGTLNYVKNNDGTITLAAPNDGNVITIIPNPTGYRGGHTALSPFVYNEAVKDTLYSTTGPGGYVYPCEYQSPELLQEELYSYKLCHDFNVVNSSVDVNAGYGIITEQANPEHAASISTRVNRSRLQSYGYSHAAYISSNGANNFTIDAWQIKLQLMNDASRR